jgi:hypothetical protein
MIKAKSSFRKLATVSFCLVFSQLGAVTVTTFGPGSAVSIVERSATFDTLNYSNVVHLENYTEGGLRISTAGDSWAADFAMAALLDPFGGASGTDRAFYAISSGNNEWVTIQTTNSTLIHGVEFMYGNTWTTGNPQVPWGNPNAVLDWQTWNNGTPVSAGTIGPNPMLGLGTVVGFYDPAGFDQLLVRSTIVTSGDPTLQALALDTLQVMLTNRPPAPVIYGSDFAVDGATGIPSLAVYDTLSGCQYRMVYTESLSTPVWNPVTPPLPGGWVSGGGQLTFSDPGAVGKLQRYYRVEVR